MDQKQKLLEGIFPVLPTPFTGEGAIDSASMQKIVAFAVDSGVNGIVFPGFASEVGELRNDERRELLSIVVQDAGKSLSVVAGGSADSAESVIEHGLFAQSLGLEYLMVQPPLAMGNGFDQVHKFLSEVTASIPEVQIVLQNAPVPRGADITPETICRLCMEIPQIRYVKEETLPSGPAISFLAKNGPSTLLGVIGGGGARFILDEYKRGACAAMPAIELADLHVKLDEAWRSGETDIAREIYVRTLPLLTLQAIYRTRLTKYVLMRRNILKETFVRAKGPDMDSEVIEDIDNNLRELGLLD